MAIGKSIEWLCMEDCHSVKLSRLLALTVLVLNGSLFRNLTTLVSYWASRSAFFFSSALSGSSWADIRIVSADTGVDIPLIIFKCQIS